MHTTMRPIHMAHVFFFCFEHMNEALFAITKPEHTPTESPPACDFCHQRKVMSDKHKKREIATRYTGSCARDLFHDATPHAQAIINDDRMT